MAPAFGERETVAVLGAGSWGTALAILLSRNGDPARLWGHTPEQMACLAADGRNARYLPDTPFPPDLALYDDLEAALDGVGTVLVVVPSHAFRPVLEQVAAIRPTHTRIAWATKGLEPGSHKLLHQVAAEVLGPAVPQAVLSGPTFAREVAAGLPTAITVASADEGYARALADRLHDDRFRAYTSADLVGVEIGGAVKNVLAIAAGIA
ncbi:MAG TPA: NAD(P)H-dependent glycerol-3-phosphate dehydrogenase, partial [Gammaproteobacteria bacterium]|nr:NAD(P)H-dependent glycerol-3-phosphate dehydrogenase [Gammaproteobacteria bacterium]